MEVHSAPAAAKRMWSYLRAVFFMARKGVLSNKRKLFISIHLLMKRRNKAVARTVANLLSHHHHHHHGSGSYYHGGNTNALRRREYEFSCSNSPDPGSFSFSSRRRHASYFPCLGAVAEDEEDFPTGAASHARIEYYATASSPAPSSPGGELLMRELAPGEDNYNYLSSPAPAGAFSVRVSNYSSEDEAGAGSDAVDDEAEEFIRRFYDQLRRQNQIAMLPSYYLQECAAA
ncbi:hypothetical protein PR202_gb03871 [Eleusine coracana subsp. coracana]|uniref:Avr9/Cf-9 rapidly elicited protein n=1 Tax=Eleusine coracana subsp. coracana TaxID=191504 RepID=A0AAV5E2C5_ELECO|nr:hypothetical protein QOZ80_1BG0095420 [Eleusine coracana subsp. coracana]GJN16847.1 hypothetical protein PR202_gb03871 [Eleusine coracana subsp. coracana]